MELRHFGEQFMSAGHIAKLRPQHAPKAPHQDPKFLESTAARPIRILAEYLHPLVQLKKEGIGDTIVMFGSARIESHETSMGRLTRLKKTSAAELPAGERAKHRAALRDAKSALEMSRYYEQARELSHRITTWALTLGAPPRRFVMCSGGGRQVHRVVHRIAPRTVCQCLHQPGTEFELSLFLYAQAVVCADCEGLDRFSGRLRHHG